MKPTPIQNKTIRPGSLKGYDYYYSSRSQPTASKPAKNAPAKSISVKKIIIFLVLILLVLYAIPHFLNNSSNSGNAKKPDASNAVVTASPKVPTKNCTGNSEEKLIKISVSQRHLWACEGAKTVYNTPVITGLRHHPETETPLGTYKIYAKQQDTTLKGTDSRGTWSDPVYYWMPFLDNQYGTYGFHDATWRPESAFGHISPDSSEASHGCIELPLGASKWLYEWAPVATMVTVQS